jgi:hypothetical protein
MCDFVRSVEISRNFCLEKLPPFPPLKIVKNIPAKRLHLSLTNAI